MTIRREIILIVILLAVITLLVRAIEFFQINIVEADASKFVLEDLYIKYPNADIGIMSISPRSNQNNAKYFEVKARVTQNPGGQCPERSHIFYNYPTQNFIPQPPEIITKGCNVCTEVICTIAFPEEAVIASHTSRGTEEVRAYLVLNPNAASSVSEQKDSWIIRWDYSAAASYYLVTISRNGSVIGIKRMAK